MAPPGDYKVLDYKWGTWTPKNVYHGPFQAIK
jgi:hypothetical protein